MIFSELMKDLRKRKNLTQKQAAEKIGCSEGSVQNWEKGSKNGSAILPNISDVEQINRIAKVYGCSYVTIYNAIINENKNILDKANSQLQVYRFLSEEIEMLTLDEEELSVLIIMGLNEKLNESNVIFNLINRFNNPALVSNYLFKLEKMKLIKGEKLSETGMYIYNVSSERILNSFNPHILTPKELMSLFKINTGLGNSFEKAIKFVLHVYENEFINFFDEFYGFETYINSFQSFFNVESEELQNGNKIIISLTYEGIQFSEFVKENFDLNMFQ